MTGTRLLADPRTTRTVPAVTPTSGRTGIPTAAFLPLVAIALGLQRTTSLRGSGDAWTHAAGVHLLAVVLLAGAVGAARLRQRPERPRTAQNTLAEGTFLLAAPTLLILWTQSTLSHAAIGLAAVTAALVTLGGRPAAGGSDETAARTFAAPVTLASVGVLLLIFGRNAGLGLQLAPSLYLPLSRGPRHPDGGTLLALLALLAAGAAWGLLWRRNGSRRRNENGAHSALDTLLLLLPAAAALLATTLSRGQTPDLTTATMIGGGALAVTVHGTMRLAAHGAPTAAIATLGGCLAAAVATRVHYGNTFTAPMIAGAVLVVTGVAAARRRTSRTTRRRTP